MKEKRSAVTRLSAMIASLEDILGRLPPFDSARDQIQALHERLSAMLESLVPTRSAPVTTPLGTPVETPTPDPPDKPPGLPTDLDTLEEAVQEVRAAVADRLSAPAKAGRS